MFSGCHRPACAQLRTRTGRSSIPEALVIEPISRGVLDHPLSRVMTGCDVAMRVPALLLMRAPVAPAHILQAAEIGAQRPPRLPLMAADAFLGLRDLALEFGHRPLHVAELVVLAAKARHLERLQRFAV